MRYVAKLDDDLGTPTSKALAGTQVKRNAGPAPIVYSGFDGDKRLRIAGMSPRFARIGRDGRAVDRAGAILAEYGVVEHRLARDRAERTQNLDLFVSDRIGIELCRRLHRHEAEQL